jgi:hypothetical protein
VCEFSSVSDDAVFGILVQREAKKCAVRRIADASRENGFLENLDWDCAPANVEAEVTAKLPN